jgi:hypothetical protein
MRFGNPTDLSEALGRARELVETAESFADDIQAALEDLVSSMKQYGESDEKEVILEAINGFIAEVDDIIRSIK